MISEKAALLLKQVIKESNIEVKLDNYNFNEDEFYYEFKINNKISENDFKNI